VVVQQIGGGIGGNRNGAGANRHVGIWNTDHVNEEWHRQDRTAAADKAKRKADERA